MKLRTKIFGLSVSIIGLLLSVIALGVFCYASITFFNSIINNRNNGAQEAIIFLFFLIPFAVVVIITIIMALVTVYHVFFIILVVKACKGGKLKVLRKIGVFISILFLLICVGVTVWMISSKIDDYTIYLIPIVYFVNSICQIIFYNKIKKANDAPAECVEQSMGRKPHLDV